MTPKEAIQCPFEIRYSFLDYPRLDKKPDIFYHVKITACTYQHTCELSPIAHRQAKRRAGKLQPDLNGMGDVIRLLREKPMLDHRILRSLLLRYLPFYQSISGVFICNFRKRALRYILDPSIELKMADARNLASTGTTAAVETIAADNPILQRNFTDLLRKVMQEDSTTWEALRYLRLLRTTVRGFDFRLKTDTRGRPEGLVWMLPHMRVHLLRYGNILFLDAQKREFNNQGWPYIGPSLKDGEMKVRVGAESICIEETLEMYVWVLRKMSSMEPRFRLDAIRIIFGDQFLSQKLLVDLGITATCTLRGDYYHLMKEVWPKYFGDHLYGRMRPFLKAMLFSKSPDEYHVAYSGAKSLVMVNPEQLSYLDNIYNKPEYYSGHTLSAIEGNLGLKGSAPAEQNHSSIVAHLGDGASWSIAKQVSELIERQQQLEKKSAEWEARLYVKWLTYTSDLSGQCKHDDECARKKFTEFAYTDIFCVIRKRAAALMNYRQADGSYMVWPLQQDPGGPGSIIVPQGERCPCRQRISYQFQCEHEYHIEGRLNLDKCSRKKWFNNHSYHNHFHNEIVALDQGTIACDDGDNVAIVELIDSDNEDIGELGRYDEDLNDIHRNDVAAHLASATNGDADDGDIAVLPSLQCQDDNNTIEVNTFPTPQPLARVTYQFALQRCSELCRTVQHDQVALASVVALVDTLTERLRMGMHIDAQFPEYNHTALDIEYDSGEGGSHSSDLQPLPSMTKTAKNAWKQKRKKSAMERVVKNTRSRRSSFGHSTKLDKPGTDSHVLPPSRVTSKSCSLCRKQGHQFNSCPVFNRYKNPPLARGAREIRESLCRDIYLSSRYATHTRPHEEEEQKDNVFVTLPKQIDGLVIHRRLLIDNTVVNLDSPENYCLECTVLHNGGEEHQMYTKALFHLGAVCKYIGASLSSIIVVEIESTGVTVQPMNNLNPASEQYVANLQAMASLSQVSQLSQSHPNRQYPHVYSPFNQWM